MENLTLRKAEASDSEFAFRVKKLALGKYIDQVWGWEETEQRRLHDRRFASQEFSVIKWSGVETGILAIVRGSDSIKLNQLLILPDYQGRGIGRACMERIIDEAAALKIPIRLQVMKVNDRAISFFHRMGFNKTGETDTHILMEKLP